MVETYRARGGSTVVLRQQRRPASLASALGGGMATLGEALGEVAQTEAKTKAAVSASEERILEIKQQRERAAAIATGAGSWADTQLAVQKQLAALPQIKLPGATGYEAAATEVVDKAVNDFLATLPDDPEVRQRFEPVVRAERDRQVGQAFSYEKTQSTAHQGDSFNKLVQAWRNAQVTKPNGTTLDQSLTDMEMLLGGLDSDGKTIEQLRTAGRNMLVTGFLDGQIQQGGFAAVQAALDGGTLDAVLTGQQRSGYARMVESGRTAQAREAEAAQGEQQRGAREAIKQIKVRINNGDDVSPSEINAALALGQNVGLPASELLEAGYLGAGAVQARQLRGMTTPAIEQQLATLRTKRDNGKLTDDEGRWQDRGERELKNRDEAVGQKLGPMLKGGAESRLAGVAQLAAMPLEQRWRAADAAGDVQAAVIAGLTNPRGRALAVQGHELRKARPDDFLPLKGPTGTGQQRAEALFKQVLGPLVGDAGTAYGALRDTALDIMAATGGKWDAENFKRAAEIIYGGSLRSDGKWQGGIGTVRGKQVELPGLWTEAEFDQRYSRYGFDGAVYADGRAVTAADVRANFRLQHAGTGEDGGESYLLIGPDGKPLVRKRNDGTTEAYLLVVPVQP